MTLLLDTLYDTLTWHSYLTQITDTDTSSANANTTAATQISHTDTSSANAIITAASGVNLTRFRDRHSRRTRHCGEPCGGCEPLRTVADGCGHKRNFWRQPRPQTPKVKREPSLRIREKGEVRGPACPKEPDGFRPSASAQRTFGFNGWMVPWDTTRLV